MICKRRTEERDHHKYHVSISVHYKNRATRPAPITNPPVCEAGRRGRIGNSHYPKYTLSQRRRRQFRLWYCEHFDCTHAAHPAPPSHPFQSRQVAFHEFVGRQGRTTAQDVLSKGDNEESPSRLC